MPIKKGKVFTVGLACVLAVALVGLLPLAAFADNPPTPAIDYVNEQIVDLDDNAYYLITDTDANEYQRQADDNGEIAIITTWFDNGLTIIETDSDYTPLAGLGATLAIPSRMAGPSGVTKTDETLTGANDGTISGLSTEMEYTLDFETPAGLWTQCDNATLSGLAPNTYYIRYIADADIPSFASEYITVTVLGASDPVCKISDTEFLSLAEALAVVADSQTIELLTNVTHLANINVDGIEFVIDLAGFDLSLVEDDSAYNLNVTGAGSKLSVANGGLVTLGAISVEDEGVLSIEADIDITVDNIYASGAAQVDVVGNIDSAAEGVIAAGEDTVVVINGNIKSVFDGIHAYDAARVEAVGNITTGTDDESEDGIEAYDGATVVVIGDIQAFYGIYVHKTESFTGLTSVTLNGSILSGDQGVHSTAEGAVVTVNGDIFCLRSGVYNLYGTVVVDGRIETSFSGITARNDAVVTVTGSITCIHTDLSDSSYAIGVVADWDTVVSTGSITAVGPRAYGVSAYIGSVVTVNGDINVTAESYAIGILTTAAIDANDRYHGNAEVFVDGTVTVSGAEKYTINIGYGSRVTIEKSLAEPYVIVFFNPNVLPDYQLVEKTAGDNDATSVKDGYIQFSGGGTPVSYVWIKYQEAVVEPQRPPTTPATGDASTLLGTSASLLFTVFGTLTLSLRRRKAQ
ncbi:MAG: hypothetical protein FWH40_00190 [Coriobacteriia bacterium]|nr:hypothetical protein [Coriobacteriia bacterium]